VKIMRRVNAVRRKEGIALLLVIGLLCILMISAVAFSISMRIERQGAFNYRYGAQARHILWAALSEAITDIDASMDDGSTMYVYPEWDVKTSAVENPSLPYRARVLSRSGANYVPSDLWIEAKSSNAYYRTVSGTNNWKVGRYAYVAVNMSGLLDASMAGGLEREGGSRAGEIKLDRLSEMINTNLFLSKRNSPMGIGRYDSYAEMFNPSTKNIIFDHWPDHFALYSLSENSEVIPPTLGKKKIYIGGSVGNSDTYFQDGGIGLESDIKQAFIESGLIEDNGVYGHQASLAYSNLLDYVDADSIPRSLDAGCAENVPMINEVVVNYSLTVRSNRTFDLFYAVDVEWFYPFDTQNTLPYTLEFDASFVAGPKNTAGAPVPSVTLSKSVPAIAVAARNSYGSKETDLGSLSGTLPAEGNYTNDFTVEVRAQIKAGAAIVDSVPYPYDGSRIKVAVNVPFQCLPTMTPSIIDTQFWSECYDPRFNWNPAGGYQWFGNREGLDTAFSGQGPSLNAKNKMISAMFGSPPDYSMFRTNPDGGTLLYVANRPLKSVGELGNICIAPWSSIRLYDHDYPAMYPGTAPPYHKVLDYFSVTNKSHLRGLVNVNTTNVAVLASVFYGLPNKEYDASTATKMTWDVASNLAMNVIAHRPYSTLSSIGTKSNNWPTYFTGPTNDIYNEAAIRNAAGLLTVRHNMFTIFLLSDSYIEGSGGKAGATLASARAVAEVWRDPFRISGTPNKHKWMIRQFKILDD